MSTNSHISAIALAAALLATPQLAQAQLGVGVDIGGDDGVSVDAGVDVGTDTGVDVDAGVDIGGDTAVDAGVDIGGDTAVDADVNTGGSTTSPSVDVDTDVLGNDALDVTVDTDSGIDANVEVLGGGSAVGTGDTLVTGDVRISALSGDDARAQALIELMAAPGLAGLNLDELVDDTQVAIVAAADLLGEEALADVRVALEAGGAGRTELLDALAASVELSAILEAEGIAPEDVLAVQIADNGATEIIVLGGAVDVAVGGSDGNLADATAADLADVDIDLLSDEELAEIDLALLPEETRIDAVVRLLETGTTPAPGDLPEGDIVTIDLDALGDGTSLAEVDAALTTGGDELAELTADVNLLDRLDQAGIDADAVVALRSTPDDDLLVFVDAGLDDTATGSIGLGTGTGTGTDAGGDGATGAGSDGTGGGDTAGGTAGSGTGGTDDGTDGSGTGSGTGGDGTGGGAAGTGSTGSGTGGSITPAVPGSTSGAGVTIASLTCEAGVQALASGADVTPQLIARAQRVQLVRIENCPDLPSAAEIEALRAAIMANPALASSLEAADVDISQVVGVSVQGDTLTLFLDSTAS